MSDEFKMRRAKAKKSRLQRQKRHSVHRIIDLMQALKQSIEKAKPSGTSFVVKEVCVVAAFVAFIDTDGVRHGVYHPDENLGVGEELSRKYAATYEWHTAEPSEMIH